MNWYETAFRKDYLDLYYRRDDASAKGEAAFAAKALGLRANSRLLDVACGAGRHARALAALGHRVTGIDLSSDLLAAATGIPRVRADMRALPFDASFDAATSFFTSFGYFDEEGNRATLRAIAGSLRSGGTFLLDFMNAVAVQRSLVPESEEVRDGRKFRIRRRIESGRVVKQVTTDERTYVESVRLYLHEELVSLLRASGLVPIDAYGDFDGRAFTTDAPRCILVARRP